MFTKWDKATAAAVGSAFTILTTGLVWLVPNKKST
jgi:hypothetical protein